MNTDENDEVAFCDGWRPTSMAATKDPDESARVGRAIRARRGRCWFNSRRAILRLEDYAEAVYVEGVAVLDGCYPIEHGWIVRNGTIIDPTLPRREAAYFPALEFHGTVGIAGFLATGPGRRCKRTPFLYAFGWGGGRRPSIMDAWQAASAYVRERAVVLTVG